MYYLKISNYGLLIIDGSHKWNGYMPQSFKIGKLQKSSIGHWIATIITADICKYCIYEKAHLFLTEY